MTVACVLITHLRAKVELLLRPDLEGTPAVIVDRSQGRPIVVDRLPAAVPIGVALEEALSLHAGTVVLEADEPAYRAAFQRVLTTLQGVSDRVERLSVSDCPTSSGASGVSAKLGVRCVLAAADSVPNPAYAASKAPDDQNEQRRDRCRHDCQPP